MHVAEAPLETTVSEGVVPSGNTVTIHGEHFEPGAVIKFGDRIIRDVESVSETLLKVTWQPYPVPPPER